MKIGILGAMPEEIEPLLKIFKDYEEIQYADNIYYKTTYQGLEIYLAYSRIGKVFSSISAFSLIEHFGCEKILFSGVAGAISQTLKIGDLILASRLCQHDLDITAFGHPFGFVPGGEVFVETDETLNALATQVAKDNDIELVQGIIATGDQFVTSTATKEFIAKEFKADALEMEGASVANVCKALSVPCLILRSISDTANEEANIDFDAFLEKSSLRSAQLLVKILDKLK